MPLKEQLFPDRRKREGGFTLILAIFLLAILASLGVAFGLLVLLEAKGSYHKRHVIRARENAKTALNQALQKIQETAGPDQRVTARGEIYNSGNADPDPQPTSSAQAGRIQGKNIGRQYYTGVWDSTQPTKQPTWLISTQPPDGAEKNHNTHPSYLSGIQYPDTDDVESDPDFVKLVSRSGKVLEDQRKQPFAELSVDDSVQLWKSAVKEGERGTDPQGYRSSGHLAWWAGDEGIKSRVNLGFGKIQEWVNKPASTNKFQFKNVTPFTAAHNFGFEGIAGLNNLYGFKDQLESIPTLHSLIPMEAATPEQVRRIYHDASASTRGVIADVKHGGLKLDLTSAMFDDTEFRRFLQGQRRFRDTTKGNRILTEPDRMFDPLLRTREGGLNGIRTKENPGGPLWSQLRSFVRLFDIVNPNGTPYDTTDDFIPIRDHTDKEHGIAPILTRLQLFFTASYEDTGIDKPVALKGGGSENKRLYRVQFHVLPAVVLWNPYDIRIEPSEFTVLFWRNTFPHNHGGYRNQCFRDYMRFEGQNQAFYVPIRYKHKMTFKIRPIGFEPGEAKVFSPLFHTEYNPYSPDGSGNLLHEGWRPGHSFYSPYYTSSHTGFDWSPRFVAGDTTGTVNLASLNEKPSAPKDKDGNITDESNVVYYVDPQNKELFVTNPRVRVKFSFGSTRRGGLVLYSHDIPESPEFSAFLPIEQTFASGNSKDPNDPSINTEKAPIQYMKKLRTYGSQPTWIVPPTFKRRGTKPLIFDSARPDPVNSSPSDHTLLCGKKYFMRFVENQGVAGTTYYPRKGLQRVRWLGDLNPRSNTFGRSPEEWNIDGYNSGRRGHDTTVTCFRTGVVNTGVNNYPIDTEPNLSLETDSPYIGYSEQMGSTRCVLFEIPRNENFLSSIGQLMHCNFTADYGEKTSPRYKNATDQYFQTGVGMREYFSDNIGPAYALGNSLTPVWLTKPNQDYQRFDVLDNNVPYGGWLYDKSHLINDALWDRYYFSGVSRDNPMGYFIDSAGEETEYNPADKAASEHVPGTFNPRVGYFWGERGMPLPSNDSRSEWYKMGERIKKFDRAAEHLAVEGSFNVNSTSVDAWRALLSSFWANPTQMATIFGLDPALVESEGESGSPYLRTHGVYTPHFRGKLEGGAPMDDANTPSAYVGYRQLYQLEIEMLAQKIVQLVKRRGPFKSLSEFINRNINSTNEWKYKGTLQEAIDTARIFPDVDGDGMPDSSGGSTYRINERFFNEQTELIDTHNGLPRVYNTQMLNRDVTNRAVATGVPGYLTQADLLARLGHILTVRSDTFIIRAYGDSVSRRSNQVMRSEVCEAVIQRFPEYFDESVNEAQESRNVGDNVHPRNQLLGRKFRVVSFRWLSREEI